MNPPSLLRRQARRATAAIVLALVALGLVCAPAAQAAGGRAPATTAPSPAPAHATFGIGPSSGSGADGRAYFSYQVTPGVHFTDRVVLVNLSAQPLALQVYPVDADPDQQGGAQLPPAGVKATAAGSWFHLSLDAGTTVHVAARASLILPFTVQVPTHATPGDHEAGLVASLAGYATNQQGARVQIDQRIAVRAFLRVAGPLSPRLTIEHLHVSYQAGGGLDPIASGTVTVSYLVHNSGNVKLGATQQVTEHGLLGSTTSAHQLAPIPVLVPGAGQLVTVRLTGVRPEVHGRVVVTVQPVAARGDADGVLDPVQQSQGLWTVPWLLIALIVLIVLLLVGGRWLRRRRRRQVAESPTSPRPRETVAA